MNRKILMICLVMIFLLCGCGEKRISYIGETEQGGLAESIQEANEVSEVALSTESKAECLVYVCGAVNSPGVYSLSPTGRIYEAIELAGGLREDASWAGINQAETIEDGMMIEVPSYLDEQTEQGEETASDGKVNLNKATDTELMTLPGVGQSKADAIIGYREEHGGFKTIEEIMNIPGIKEGVFEKIKDSIKV